MPSINHQRGETRRRVADRRHCHCPACDPARHGWMPRATRAQLRAALALSEALASVSAAPPASSEPAYRVHAPGTTYHTDA